MGARSIYIRKKQRYALTAFLKDIGWSNRRILIPAFTCHSVSQAIKKSGNNVYFYDINKDFTVNIGSLKKTSENGVDAVIVSDVYGIEMDISQWLNETDKHPLIIGDFAHHENISFNSMERKYCDVVMYSSAYYKPIASSGAGILAVISDRVDTEDSLMIDFSLFRAIYDSLIIYAIDKILEFPIVKYVIDFIIKNEGETYRHALKTVEAASSVSLAQILDSIDRSPMNRKEIKRSYLSYMSSLVFIDNKKEEAMTYLSFLVEPGAIKRIHAEALKKGVLLGRIFHDIAGMGDESCPTANYTSQRVLNLPFLRINKKDRIKKVSHIVLEAIHQS